MRPSFRLIFPLVAVLLLGCLPAFADSVYEFTNLGVSGGTIKALGGGQFEGIGIELDNFATPSNIFGYTITDGLFNFDTSTGLFSITGDIGGGNTMLLSGSLLGFTIGGGCGSNDPFCDIDFTAGVTNLGTFGGFTMAGENGDPNGGPWTAYSTDLTATETTVPEPSSLVLLTSGLMIAGTSLRRRWRRN